MNMKMSNAGFLVVFCGALALGSACGDDAAVDFDAAPANADADADALPPELLFLSLSNGQIALLQTFEPSQLFYQADAQFQDTEVSVSATALDPSATILVDGSPVASGVASSPIALDLGVNQVSVQVTVSSGDSLTYELEITRGAALLEQVAYGKASNSAASDHFGNSLALSGDTLVVGAPNESSSSTGVDGDQANNSSGGSGAVYVFRQTGTTWAQEAYLKASNTEVGDQFGISVAVSGETLAVGAPLENSNATGIDGNESDNGAQDSGAVYVFRRTGTTWSQEAYVKASNTGAGDAFGDSLSLSGDTLAVGAYAEESSATGVDGNQADDSAGGSGAVYVFRRTDSTWGQEAYIKASNAGIADTFGRSLALSGDDLAVGAPNEDSNAIAIDGNQADNSAENSGAVYVFRRTGTAWTQEAYVKAHNTASADNLGDTVALSGDTLAVGAHAESSISTGGQVYVFRRTGTGWAQERHMKASNASNFDGFGRSVALSGDTLAVGAQGEQSNATGVDGDQADDSAGDSGAVYVFRRTGTTWVQEAYVKASNTGVGDRFGNSVALSGDTLAVGAYFEASNATGFDGNQADDSASFSGAVYLFAPDQLEQPMNPPDPAARPWRQQQRRLRLWELR